MKDAHLVTDSYGHKRVAEPGFALTVTLFPNSGFFTLVWHTRTACMPMLTSHEAQVPALHWYVTCAPACKGIT